MSISDSNDNTYSLSDLARIVEVYQGALKDVLVLSNSPLVDIYARSSLAVTIDFDGGSTAYAGKSPSQPLFMENDDHGNTPAVATALPFDFSFTNGTLDPITDVDVFSIEITAPNQAIKFTTTLIDAVSGSMFRLTISDATGAELFSEVSDSSGAFFVPAGPQRLYNYYFENTGTYFVSFEGVDLPAAADYGIRAVEMRDDYANTTDAATFINLSQDIQGRYNYFDDIDVFQFTLDAADTVIMSLNAFGFIRVFDAQGAVVFDAVSNSSRGFTQDFEAGVYFLELRNYQNAQFDNSSTAYNFSIRTASDDFSSDTATLGLISEDAPASGQIGSADDSDWFKFEASAGQSVVFSIDPGLNMRVRDSEGNMLILKTGFDAAGPNLDYNFVETGTYFIEVFDPNFSSFTNYTLQSRIVAPDVGDTVETAQALNIGEIAADRLSEGDQDFYAVDLTTSNSYILEGSPVSFNPYQIELLSLSPDGEQTLINRIMRDGDPIRVEVDGTYYLRVTRFFNEDVEYSFTLNSESDAAVALPIDGTLIQGRIDYRNDEDTFTFSLDQLTAISFPVDIGAEPDARAERVMVTGEDGREFYGRSEGYHFGGLGVYVLPEGTYTVEYDSFDYGAEYTISARIRSSDASNEIGALVQRTIVDDSEGLWLTYVGEPGRYFKYSAENTAGDDYTAVFYDSSGAVLRSSTGIPGGLYQVPQDGNILVFVEPNLADLNTEITINLEETIGNQVRQVDSTTSILIENTRVQLGVGTQSELDADGESLVIALLYSRSTEESQFGENGFVAQRIDEDGNLIGTNVFTGVGDLFVTPLELISVEDGYLLFTSRFNSATRNSVIEVYKLDGAGNANEANFIFEKATSQVNVIQQVNGTIFTVNHAMTPSGNSHQIVEISADGEVTNIYDLPLNIDSFFDPYLFIGKSGETRLQIRRVENDIATSVIFAVDIQGGGTVNLIEISASPELSAWDQGVTMMLDGFVIWGRELSEGQGSEQPIEFYKFDENGEYFGTTTVDGSSLFAPQQIYGVFGSVTGDMWVAVNGSIHRIDNDGNVVGGPISIQGGRNSTVGLEFVNDTDFIVTYAEAANGFASIDTQLLTIDETRVLEGPQAATSGNDLISGTSNRDVIDGLVGNDTLFGNQGDDVFFGSSGDDQLYGEQGNDSLYGGGGVNQLYGGEGADILVDAQSFFSVDGGLLLGDDAPPLSLASVEGQIFRAYQAVFDRAPDLGGFDLFAGEVRAGRLTQEAVISQFVDSQEFQLSYGTLGNEAFVRQLYLNVLDREGDANGVAAFTAAIDGGTTRASVVAEFANSPEFVQLMILPSASFATNVITHPAEGQVFRIYQAVFNRAPDAGGFTAFTNSIQAGVLTPTQITAEFVASPEFQETYGELTNAQFAETLYTNVLPGNADAAGRAAFTAALDAQTLTRAAMVAEFAESQELRSRTNDAVTEFVSSVFADNADVLDSGTGNDILFGGRGADTFNYDVSTDGADIVLDFTSGTDRLNLSGSVVFDSFGEVMVAGTQIGQSAVFNFGGGNMLTLEGVILSELSETDFGFDMGSSAEKQDVEPASEVIDETLDTNGTDGGFYDLRDQEPQWVIDALI